MTADVPAASELLGDLAAVVRSKNAGPFECTIDIMFDDADVYWRVLRSGVLTRALVCRLYRITDDRLLFLGQFDAALAIKITMVRPMASGGVGDRDVNACQQHAPLLDVRIPGARSAAVS